MPPPARRGTTGIRLAGAAVLSACAGVVHVAAALPHWADSRMLGLGFLAVGLAQLATAGLLLRRDPPRAILPAALTLHGVAVAAWAVSRTVGLPLGHPGPEPAALADLLSVGFELAAMGLVAWRLRDRRTFSARRPAAIGLVVVAAALATGGSAFAVADLGTGHGHGAGGSVSPVDPEVRQHPATVTGTSGHHDEEGSAHATGGLPAGWSSRTTPVASNPPEDRTAAGDAPRPAEPEHETGHTHAPGEDH